MTVTGSKFVSTAREDKYGAGEIGIPQIGIIGAMLPLWAYGLPFERIKCTCAIPAIPVISERTFVKLKFRAARCFVTVR